MASNHGKQFEKDMLKSVRSWGWWAERFRDNTFGVGGRTASHESPPDMIAMDISCLGIIPKLMELKAVKANNIPLSRCSGHQLKRLQEFPGEAFVVAMFYEGDRAQSRSAVMIPVGAWATAQQRYDRLSVPLRYLREDLSASHHLRWVGRGAEIGPWVRCTRLGETPKKDQ